MDEQCFWSRNKMHLEPWRSNQGWILGGKQPQPWLWGALHLSLVNAANSPHNPQPTVPAQVRSAAMIAAAQSLIGLGYAVVLIVRGMLGYRDAAIVYQSDDANTAVGYGTAIFFILVFGAVIFGAWRMSQGCRWGRGPVMMLELLLVPIAIYMLKAGAWILGAITGISALMGLAMLFSAPAVAWASERFRD